MHDFKTSLALSHSASDLPIWEEIYRNAFPAFAGMIDHRADGEHQRAGIDRSVILENANQILIDEKVRWKNAITGVVYEDIALEVWSSEEHKTPGWVCKPIRADYIAYAIAPLGKCYLLPVIQLQSAWVKNRHEWLSKFRQIRAKNNGYTTVSVGIPVNVLMSAIGANLRLSFTPICEAEAA